MNQIRQGRHEQMRRSSDNFRMCSRIRFVLFAISLAALMGLTSGCGQSNEPERIELFGKVTFNGQSLAEGDISLHPESGSAGPPASGLIRAGEYKFSGESGVVPGKYQVKINGYRGHLRTIQT